MPLRLPRPNRSGSSPSLGRQMGRAAAWSSLGSIVMRLGSFSVGIIAARLIAPDQFGVFAVALTVHAIIVNISDLGVSAYVVRQRGNLDAVGPTVTTIALASAVLLAGSMALAAPWISTELGSSDATGPVQILSLTVLLAGVSSVPGAMLTREFRQDKRFLADFANFAASTAILLVLALLGGGALALAWSRVAGQGVSTIVLLLATPKRYLPGLNRAVSRSVIAFGAPLVGSSFLGFLINNIDFIVVGRMLGAEPLGFYYLAYNAGSWPYVILAPIIASITVAAFSRVRHDTANLKARVGTSIAALLGLALPANALIVALADPLVDALYGSRWSPAAAALALTAVYGAARVATDFYTNLAIAEGRTRALLVSQLAYLVALLPLTLVGVARWGIVGAGAAHIVAIVVVLLPWMICMLAKATGFGLLDFARTIVRPLFASVAAGFAAHFAATSVSGPWLALLAGGTAGVAVYLLLIASWGRATAAAARGLWSHTDATTELEDDRPGAVAPPVAAGA